MKEKIRQALQKLGWTPKWQETLEELLDDGLEVVAFAEERDEIHHTLTLLEGQCPEIPKVNTTEHPKVLT